MSRTWFSSTFLGHWSDKYNERQTKVVLNRMEKGVRVLSFLLQYRILLRDHCSNLSSVHPSSAPIPVHKALSTDTHLRTICSEPKRTAQNLRHLIDKWLAALTWIYSFYKNSITVWQAFRNMQRITWKNILVVTSIYNISFLILTQFVTD